jgi:hypothetical protein
MKITIPTPAGNFEVPTLEDARFYRQVYGFPYVIERGG